MKFLAALLVLTGFAYGAAPDIKSVAVKLQTGGDVEIVTVINPGGVETDLKFTYGVAGDLTVPEVTRFDESIPTSNLDESRPLNLVGLKGGKTYYLRAEALRNGAPVVPAEFEQIEIIVNPYSTIEFRPAVVTAPTPTNPLSVTLTAGITPSGGTVDSVTFEYGLTSGSYPSSVPATRVGVTNDFTATITNTDDDTPLRRGIVYHYRAVVVTSTYSTESADATFTTPANRAPIANPDPVNLRGDQPIVIDVLKNDKDLDGDEISIVSVTQGKQGRVEIVDGQIRYTPIPDANGGDTFTYTIRDDYVDEATTGPDTKSATATVTINSPGLTSRGMHAVELKDAEGNVVGLIRLIGTGNGTVTGKVQLFTQTYTLMGQIDANGHFYFTIPRDENGPLQLDVDFSGDDDEGGIDVSLKGDGNFWSGEEVPNTLTDPRRDQLVGKYTVELPAPGGDDLPKGIGFARVDIKPWGDVSIKGRLGDGSKFSTRGVLTGSDSAPVVSMFATPGDTRLRANFQFGSGEANLTGPFVWYRDPDSGAMFPDGIYAEITMNGSRLVPAEDGRRTLTDAKKATITLTDGNLSTAITQSIEISKSDRVNILGSNPFGVTMKIDRENGTFKGQFDHPFDDSRRKFLGVLLQAQEKGSGVFTGINQTGSVALSIGIVTPVPTPTPTPTPTPNPTTPPPTFPTNGGGRDF